MRSAFAAVNVVTTPLYVPARLLWSVVDLAASDIQNLNSAGITLASCSSGTVIVPVTASFQYKKGSVAFTNDAVVEIAVGGDVILSSVSTVQFSTLTSRLAYLAQQAVVDLQSVFSGADCQVHAAATDPGGAGDGTARVALLYYVVPLL